MQCMILLPLRNSELFFMADEDDYEILSSLEWREREGYPICCSSGSGSEYETQSAHRIVMKLTPQDKEEIDHKNRNRMDLRKSNLRIANRSDNMSNRSKFKRKDVTSKFKGVCSLKGKDYYQVRIQYNKKPITIGHYYSENASANMYNHYALKIHGEFAVLNDVD